MEFDTKPDYFVSEESPTPSPETPSPPRRRLSRWVKWVIAIVVLGLGIGMYVRYFTPYVVDARVKGYVTNVERRGIICRTFEGEMISEGSLTDTAVVYQRDFTFSVPNDSLALEIQKYQNTGRPVTLVYKRYYAPVPWRGSSPRVIVGMETEP